MGSIQVTQWGGSTPPTGLQSSHLPQHHLLPLHTWGEGTGNKSWSRFFLRAWEFLSFLLCSVYKYTHTYMASFLRIWGFAFSQIIKKCKPPWFLVAWLVGSSKSNVKSKDANQPIVVFQEATFSFLREKWLWTSSKRGLVCVVWEGILNIFKQFYIWTAKYQLFDSIFHDRYDGKWSSIKFFLLDDDALMTQDRFLDLEKPVWETVGRSFWFPCGLFD